MYAALGSKERENLVNILNGIPANDVGASSRRTMSPLDRACPDTSVFSALETFVIIALIKSTFTIPSSGA